MFEQFELTWNDIKIRLASKKAFLQYIILCDQYVIWFTEEGIKYFTIINIDTPANTNQTD